MDIKERLRTFLGAEAAGWVMNMSHDDFDGITELRLRADKPMFVRIGGEDYVLTRRGKTANVGFQGAYRPSAEDIAETMERISQYSFYAFETELSHGYITLPGGHRVGIAGQAVIENGVVQAWRHISSINFRVAHSVKGCGDEVLPFLYENNRIHHTMIISPPGAGKTTLLRDIIRQISDGGLTVGLVDERSEVAGCFRGIPQNDVGLRTDVLDGCPKPEGMHMLLRAMAPDVIAVDELGGREDAKAVEAVLTAGVRLLCTAHGDSFEDVMKNPGLAGLISRKVFGRYIVLSAPGAKPQILDGGGSS
ncbi:MAG: stage III sporulation protein AA [Defluviitaleaceae bacterium]|nr:stage III sporulation protein AA [Defluviitaleaceae bacterium]